MGMFAFLGSCGLGWVLACVLRDWCLVVVRCGLGRSAAVVVIAATACRLVVCVWWALIACSCTFVYGWLIVWFWWVANLLPAVGDGVCSLLLDLWLCYLCCGWVVCAV